MKFAVILGALVAVSLVGINGIFENVVEYQRGENWNKRGYFRCVDGHWDVGNIDLLGHNKDGSALMNLSNECEADQ